METIYYAHMMYKKDKETWDIKEVRICEETNKHLIVCNPTNPDFLFMIKKEDLDQPNKAYHTTKLHALVHLKARAKARLDETKAETQRYQEMLYDIDKEMLNH